MPVTALTNIVSPMKLMEIALCASGRLVTNSTLLEIAPAGGAACEGAAVTTLTRPATSAAAWTTASRRGDRVMASASTTAEPILPWLPHTLGSAQRLASMGDRPAARARLRVAGPAAAAARRGLRPRCLRERGRRERDRRR